MVRTSQKISTLLDVPRLEEDILLSRKQELEFRVRLLQNGETVDTVIKNCFPEIQGPRSMSVWPTMRTTGVRSISWSLAKRLQHHHEVLLDHDVPVDVSYSLKHLGHQVFRLPEVLNPATSDERVLILPPAWTDIDYVQPRRFLKLAGAVSHAGIIV